MSFEQFVEEYGTKLRASLVASYGPELGVEVTADALAYGWEHWDRLSGMDNPSGYLFRVGQTSARRRRVPSGYLPKQARPDQPEFEPALVPALERLTEPQRISIILVHALGWPLTDAAEVLNVSVSTVRTHIHRALTKLRTSLKVDSHAS